MTSYLRKYVTALASAKDYVAQWSSDHVFADEELIVPFPTLAIFEPNRRVWLVNIKAWIYVPFQSKSLTSYLPSLPRFIRGGGNNKKDDEAKAEKPADSKDETHTKETVFNEDERKISQQAKSADVKVDKDKKDAAAAASHENHQAKKEDNASDSDDDLYEDALREELGVPEENPGRLGLFFVGSSMKIATKTIINGVEHFLSPSDESGFIEQNLEIPDKELISYCSTTHDACKDKKFEYQITINRTKQAEMKKGENADKNSGGDDADYRTFKCTIYVLARHGISVISDIDDTIKISNVLSKRLLLKHTFYSYFKPVEGMSELYQKWNEQKCQFHYVSASPWQLFPALRCFMEKYKFPLGTMNLRRFSWSMEFLHPADTYKIETITKIIDAYPLRRYICVGDSGELDPEIYSKLYIQYDRAIAHIFIRDVCYSPTCLPTCQERYRKAFEGVPKERWTIFKDPKEIETDIKKILSV